MLMSASNSAVMRVSLHNGVSPKAGSKIGWSALSSSVTACAPAASAADSTAGACSG